MRKIDKAEMGENYIKMGKLNLAICETFFHLETEGARRYEMASKKTEGETK